MNESELVEKILQKDRQALSIFYKTFAPKLSRFISIRIANPKDAEELLQDTLFSFLEALRDYEHKSSLQTYLYSICHHKVIDYYRRKKLKHFVFSQIPQLETLISPLMTPEAEYDARALQEKITKTLNTILPKYKKVLLSKYADNLSVVDIARNFAVTVKSAESILFRARKAFVKAFVSI